MLQYDVAKVSSQGTSCAVAGTRGGGGKLIWNFLKSSARSSGMQAPLEELPEEALAELGGAAVLFGLAILYTCAICMCEHVRFVCDACLIAKDVGHAHS
jgi:hypothetical protein